MTWVICILFEKGKSWVEDETNESDHQESEPYDFLVNPMEMFKSTDSTS